MNDAWIFLYLADIRPRFDCEDCAKCFFLWVLIIIETAVVHISATLGLILGQIMLFLNH